MRKKNDGSINMGKVLSAEISFEMALSDSETSDPVLSKISSLASGCKLISEFILENEEHYENVENTNNSIAVVMDSLHEINEELRAIRKELNEIRYNKL